MRVRVLPVVEVVAAVTGKAGAVPHGVNCQTMVIKWAKEVAIRGNVAEVTIRRELLGRNQDALPISYKLLRSKSGSAAVQVSPFSNWC